MEGGPLMTVGEAAERAGMEAGVAQRALVAVGVPLPAADVPFIDEGLFGTLVGAQVAITLSGEAPTMQFSGCWVPPRPGSRRRRSGCSCRR